MTTKTELKPGFHQFDNQSAPQSLKDLIEDLKGVSSRFLEKSLLENLGIDDPTKDRMVDAESLGRASAIATDIMFAAFLNAAMDLASLSDDGNIKETVLQEYRKDTKKGRLEFLKQTAHKLIDVKYDHLMDHHGLNKDKTKQ